MPSVPRQLIVVSDVFEFLDGTLHFSPPMSIPAADRLRLKVGDHLELRRPNGTTIETTLLGIDRFSPSNGTLGLYLGEPFTKADVPVGTQIWRVG
jgi:hypothetical protein